MRATNGSCAEETIALAWMHAGVRSTMISMCDDYLYMLLNWKVGLYVFAEML